MVGKIWLCCAALCWHKPYSTVSSWNVLVHGLSPCRWPANIPAPIQSVREHLANGAHVLPGFSCKAEDTKVSSGFASFKDIGEWSAFDQKQTLIFLSFSLKPQSHKNSRRRGLAGVRTEGPGKDRTEVSDRCCCHLSFSLGSTETLSHCPQPHLTRGRNDSWQYLSQLARWITYLFWLGY